MASRSAALALLAEGLSAAGCLARSCSGASTSSRAYGPTISDKLGSIFYGSRRRQLTTERESRQGQAPPSLTSSTSTQLHEQGSIANSLLRSSRISSSAALQCQLRYYRSNKRSLKPLNSAASWLAVKPILEQQQQQQAGGHIQKSRSRLGPLIDTALPEIPEVPTPEMYRRIGKITGPYHLELEKIFGVVEIGASQFKVTTDDVIFVNHLSGVDINDVLSLDRVMLVGTQTQTVIGRPYVPGAQVLVAVEEHFKDGKVHVFKKKRKKRYRKYQAPRQSLTTLRVLKVLSSELAQGDVVGMLPKSVKLGDEEDEVKAEDDVDEKAQAA